MRLIGITGGIGSGKSVISRVLRTKGYHVYDCDSEARQLMDASAELKADIATTLGAECLFGDGTLDRGAIAARVFGDSELLAWLNHRVHELVRNDIKAVMAVSQEELFFVESAVMHTAALDRMCDEIWLVQAPEALRLQRACRRDNADPAKIKARMEAQRDEFDALQAPIVHEIINDGQQSLILQIDKLLTQ